MAPVKKKKSGSGAKPAAKIVKPAKAFVSKFAASKAPKIIKPPVVAVPLEKKKQVKPKFKIGEMIVYPFHGVGVVREVKKLDITGEAQWYYTLDFRNGELTVKLPVSQQEERGMRRVVPRSEVPKILTILRKKPAPEETDWKVRYNIYLEKLKSGDIYETAKVARNLSKRGPEGELSMSEKRLLEASMQLLVHEIASASREPVEKIEAEINKYLRGSRA